MTTDVRALSSERVTAHAGTPAERLERGGGWWTLILALAMLLAMTEALNAAAWSEGLATVRLAVLGGAALAFALALTRWEGFFPVCYSFLASLAWITVSFNQIIFTNLNAQEGVRELVTRNVNWMAALVNGTASADNLVFVTQLGVLGWWIGYLAVWSLMRHQSVLRAVIPAGVALLVNAYYAATAMTPHLIVYLVAVLLLAIRVELARNQVRWQLTRVRYAPDITLDFLKAGVFFSALVILLAWAVPDVADRITVERLLRPFEGPWQRIEDTWTRMYRSLNYGRSVTQPASFSKTLSLGGPVSLTDRPIFDGETPERTYWRAVAYDTYTGQGWLNTDSEVVVVERDQPFAEPVFAARPEMTVTVRLLEPGRELIFAPPQPVRINVPVNADVTLLPGDDEERTISQLRSRISLGPERPYQVVSAVTAAAPDLLRADHTNYPAWVRERYLQLPEEVPFRVTDLAARITTAYTNPFDKAEALEAVLRTYKYNLQIAAPPPGQDAVDYFLFDSKEGYCDYYASALVVMLRSVGVPARIVVGYAPGQLEPKREQDIDDEINVYRVLERNAHAWPEVYFPTYGWIQFEPTASEPVLVRPRPQTIEPLEPGLNPANMPNQGGLDPERPDEGILDTALPVQMGNQWVLWLSRHWGWLAGAALLILGIGGGWALRRRQQNAFFQDVHILTRLFDVLGKWAARLHVPWPASHTPLEHVTEFSRKMPEAGPTVTTLADMYVAQCYGRQQPQRERLNTLAQGWQVLQPKLWQRWLLGEWPRNRMKQGQKEPVG